MKLNNLASAVSISLAALALTACGSDDNTSSGSAPIVQDDAAKRAAEEAAKKKAAEEAAKKAAEEAKKAEKENIDKLVKAALEAGLNANQANAIANANKTLKADSPEFKKLLADAVKAQKENSPISDVVTVTNPFIDNFDSSKVSSVSTAHYIRKEDSNYDVPANADKSASSGNSSFFNAAEQNPWLSNYAFGVEASKSSKKIIAVDATGEEVDNAGNQVTEAASLYTQTKGLEYKTADKQDKETPIKYTYAADVRTLQAENVKNTDISAAGLTAAKAEANIPASTAPETDNKTGLVVYNSKSKYDAAKKSLAPAFGQEENSYKLDKDNKLQAINQTVETATAAHGYAGSRETANNFTTRIFGKNYKDLESSTKADQKTDNTYVAPYNLETGKADAALNNVKTARLQYVQYGRLSNNIDALSAAEKDRERSFIYRQYQEHGAPTTVDTYFYRGTHQTTIDQMKEVQAKGGTLQYFGHALTYGLGPHVPTKGSQHVPTAFGGAKKEATIGNFAQAKYDIAKNQVTGSIYNLVRKDETDTKAPFERRDLATFDGGVSGNTVIGQSKKVGTEEVGSFTGSFYGPKASEFGGNIASITRKEGYAEPKWGAVFGTILHENQTSDIGNWSVGQSE